MATIREVGVGKEYATIQDAINAASNGDTIIIAAGDYTTEGGIQINKALTVKAAEGEKVIVDHVVLGNSWNDPKVSAVTVSGLTITPKSKTDVHYVGVWQNNTNISAITIENCVIDFSNTPVDVKSVGIKSSRGIVDAVETLIITGNTIIGTDKTQSYITAGDKGSISSVTVEGNTCSGGSSSSAVTMDFGYKTTGEVSVSVKDNKVADVTEGHGINFGNVKNSDIDITVTGNTVENVTGKDRAAINMHYSSTEAGKVTVSDNVVSGSIIGVNMSTVQGVVISKNTLTDCGESIIYTDGSVISGNTVDGKEMAFPAYSGSDILVYDKIAGEAGDTVVIDGKSYVVGTNVFADVSEAMKLVENNGIIKIAGTANLTGESGVIAPWGEGTDAGVVALYELDGKTVTWTADSEAVIDVAVRHIVLHGEGTLNISKNVVLDYQQAPAGGAGESLFVIGSFWAGDDATEKVTVNLDGKIVVGDVALSGDNGSVKVRHNGVLNVSKTASIDADYSIRVRGGVLNVVGTGKDAEEAQLKSQRLEINGAGIEGGVASVVNIKDSYVSITYGGGDIADSFDMQDNRDYGYAKKFNFENSRVETGTLKLGDSVTVFMGKDSDFTINKNVINAATIKLEGSTFDVAGTVTNNGIIKVSGESDIKAAVSGNGWMYMNGVTLDKDTQISGAKIRFASGNNVIDGATINTKDALGVFEVGARTSEPDPNVDYKKPITVTVKNSTIASSSGGECAYVGEKNTLAIENSLTYFKQINSDGNFSITGDTAGTKFTWGRNVNGLESIEYSTYIGTFNVFDGEATLKNTSFHALNNKIYGKLTVDGSTAYFTGGAGFNTGLNVFGDGGVLTVKNASTVYANDFVNEGTITLDGENTKMILTGVKKTGNVTTPGEHNNQKNIEILNNATLTDNGVDAILNNNGTVTVNGGILDVVTINNAGNITVVAKSVGDVVAVTADTITGEGMITIDAADFSGVKKVIDISDKTKKWEVGSNIKFENLGNVKVAYGADGDVVLANVDTKTLYVNSSWATADKDPDTDGVQNYEVGDEVAEGKYFGFNAFASSKDAVAAAMELGGATINVDGLGAESNFIELNKAGNYIVTGGKGKDSLLVRMDVKGDNVNLTFKDAFFRSSWCYRASAGNTFTVTNSVIGSAKRSGADGGWFTALYTPTRIENSIVGIKCENFTADDIKAMPRSAKDVKAAVEAKTYTYLLYGENNSGPHIGTCGEFTVKDSTVMSGWFSVCDRAIMSLDNSVLYLGASMGIGVARPDGVANSNLNGWDGQSGGWANSADGFRTGKAAQVDITNSIVRNVGWGNGNEKGSYIQVGGYVDDKAYAGILNITNSDVDLTGIKDGGTEVVDESRLEVRDNGIAKITDSTVTIETVKNEGEFTVNGGTLDVGTLTNNGDFTVKGTSTLKIDKLTGTAINLYGTLDKSNITGNVRIVGDAAVIKDSTVAGTVSDSNIGTKALTIDNSNLNGLLVGWYGKSYKQNYTFKGNSTINGSAQFFSDTHFKIADAASLEITKGDLLYYSKSFTVSGDNSVLTSTGNNYTCIGGNTANCNTVMTIEKNAEMNIGSAYFWVGYNVYERQNGSAKLQINSGATANVTSRVIWLSENGSIEVNSATLNVSKINGDKLEILEIKNKNNNQGGNLNISGTSTVYAKVDDCVTVTLAKNAVLAGDLTATITVSGTASLAAGAAFAGSITSGTLKVAGDNDLNLTDSAAATLIVAAGDYSDDTFGAVAIKGATKNAELTLSAAALAGNKITNAKVNFTGIDKVTSDVEIAADVALSDIKSINENAVKSVNGVYFYTTDKTYILNKVDDGIDIVEAGSGSGDADIFKGEQGNFTLTGDLGDFDVTMKSGKTTIKVAKGDSAAIGSIRKSVNGGVTNITVKDNAGLTVAGNIDSLGKLTAGKASTIDAGVVSGTNLNTTISLGRGMETAKFASIDLKGGKNTLSVGAGTNAEVTGDVKNVRSIKLANGKADDQTSLVIEKGSIVAPHMANTITLGSNATLLVAKGLDNSDINVGTTVKAGKNSRVEFGGEVKSLAGLNLGTDSSFATAGSPVTGTSGKNTIALGTGADFIAGSLDLISGNDTAKLGKEATMKVGTLDFGEGKDTLTLGKDATLFVDEILNAETINATKGSTIISENEFSFLNDVKGSWNKAQLIQYGALTDALTNALTNGYVGGNVFANEWDVYTFNGFDTLSLSEIDNASLKLFEKVGDEWIAGSEVFSSTFDGTLNLDSSKEYALRVSVDDLKAKEEEEYSFKATLA